MSTGQNFISTSLVGGQDGTIFQDIYFRADNGEPLAGKIRVYEG